MEAFDGVKVELSNGLSPKFFLNHNWSFGDFTYRLGSQ